MLEIERSFIPAGEYPYRGNQDLMLRRGLEFNPHSCTPHPMPRACFAASYAAATRKNSRFVYCEGFAINSDAFPLAIHHAWIVRRDDPLNVIEMAWKQPGLAYIGLPFQPSFLRQMRKRTRQYCVLDAWMIHYPLLTGKISLDDVLEPL